jgi:hypothetical protein
VFYSSRFLPHQKTLYYPRKALQETNIIAFYAKSKLTTVKFDNIGPWQDRFARVKRSNVFDFFASDEEKTLFYADY